MHKKNQHVLSVLLRPFRLDHYAVDKKTAAFIALSKGYIFTYAKFFLEI